MFYLVSVLRILRYVSRPKGALFCASTSQFTFNLDFKLKGGLIYVLVLRIWLSSALSLNVFLFCLAFSVFMALGRRSKRASRQITYLIIMIKTFKLHIECYISILKIQNPLPYPHGLPLAAIRVL